MGMKILEECSVQYISKYTKIFINGAWIGIIEYPIRMVKFLRLYKRNNIIDKYTCRHILIINITNTNIL